jgi:antitoxin component HigA of HigAB toxin-antitoxin module
VVVGAPVPMSAPADVEAVQQAMQQFALSLLALSSSSGSSGAAAAPVTAVSYEESSGTTGSEEVV